MTKRELERLWTSAGGPALVASTAAAIALAESGGQSIPNSSGSGATGIWQIKGAAIPGTESELEDPQVNAANAVAKYKDAGNSFSPWQTYVEGTYQRYLGAEGTPGAGATSTSTSPSSSSSPSGLVGVGIKAFLYLALILAAGALLWIGSKTALQPRQVAA